MTESFATFTSITSILERDEQDDLSRWVAVLDSFLRLEQKRFFQQHAAFPVIASFGSDGTPVKLSKRVSTQSAGDTVVRHGKVGLELLVQRNFLAAITPDGMKMFTRPAIPYRLQHNNTALSNFGAAKKFVAMARSGGARNVVIQHTVLDGKFFKTLREMFEQLAALQYVPASPRWWPQDLPIAVYQLMDWSLATPCALHILNRALCWSMDAFSVSAELSKNLFRVIESTRYSVEDAHACLPGWVRAHLVADTRVAPFDVLVEMWTALGLTSHWADRFAYLGLLWLDGKLMVDIDRAQDEDLISAICACIMVTMKLKKFVDTRLLTLAESTRACTCCFLLGVDALVTFILDHRNGSEYYMGGIRLLDIPVRQYCVVSAFSSGAIQSALAFLLEDGRLAMHKRAVRKGMHDELEFIVGLPSCMWQLILRAMPQIAPHWLDLRSWSLHALCVSLSFADVFALSLYDRFPWSSVSDGLEHCDARLEEVRVSGVIQETGTGEKIRLMLLGGLHAQARVGCEAIQYIRCSTIIQEQDHAAEARVHQTHPEMELQSLRQRSFAVLCKPLLMQNDTSPACARQAIKK